MDGVHAYASEVISLGLLYQEFHNAMEEGNGDKVMSVEIPHVYI